MLKRDACRTTPESFGFRRIACSIFDAKFARAELNGEIEHQTAKDSTVQGEKPLGERGAAKARYRGFRRGGLTEKHAVNGIVPRSVLQSTVELGYSEGEDLVIKYRFAEGDARRFPGLAVELVRLSVDVFDGPALSMGEEAVA